MPLGGEESGCDEPPCSTEAMHSSGVKGVIHLENIGHQLGGEHINDSRDQANDESSPWLHTKHIFTHRERTRLMRHKRINSLLYTVSPPLAALKSLQGTADCYMQCTLTAALQGGAHLSHRAGGGDAYKPAECSVRGTDEVVDDMAGGHHLQRHEHQQRRNGTSRSREGGVDGSQGSHVAKANDGESGAGVEAIPSEPEDEDTEDGQGGVVTWNVHRLQSNKTSIIA